MCCEEISRCCALTNAHSLGKSVSVALAGVITHSFLTFGLAAVIGCGHGLSGPQVNALQEASWKSHSKDHLVPLCCGNESIDS